MRSRRSAKIVFRHSEIIRMFVATIVLISVTTICSSSATATATATATADANASANANDVIETVGSVSFAMKAIPGGQFQMGSKDGESNEKPVRTVNISPFYLAETELTWNLYQLCIDENRCQSDGNAGEAGGNHPTFDVSWNDINQDFLPWLNGKTGREFRLPSEAEWEYAARANSTTRFSWGDDIDCSKAHWDGGKDSLCYYKPDGVLRGTSQVRSLHPNPFGLYDMHGNVWEWVNDCWNASYAGAPINGDAWMTGECNSAVVRGGSWYNNWFDLRSARRIEDPRDGRSRVFGFRLAHD